MRKILNGTQMVLGTCYYPEHWPEHLWEEDLRRMLACGIKVIRIAEFAWSKIEPKEGEFTYTFFDQFLELAEKVGVSRQTISAIEKGDYNPTINLCIAICRTLGKTLDELFWES